MKETGCDVLILGGVRVGLAIAHQLVQRGLTSNSVIVDKEAHLGLHSSGRNSGVLHAGLYYKPDSMKAKVCVEGAKRLRSWVEQRNLPLNPCGKVIVPQRGELDAQLDVLAERGKANGAKVELWDADQLHELIPGARTASGRALWSPNTAVVKPSSVVRRLHEELTDKGVKIINNQQQFMALPKKQVLALSDGIKLSYGHLFNCTGLQADRVSRMFGVGHQYTLLPFKGIYWEVKQGFEFQPRTNLYPVPDLNVPFLGVHFTPNTDATPTVSIGPTATPALGRENYKGFEGMEPSSIIKNLGVISSQYLSNNGGFRRYVHEQAFLAMPPLLIRAAQELIPTIKPEHIKVSKKVGIRSQYLTDLLSNWRTILFACKDLTALTYLTQSHLPLLQALHWQI